MKKNTIPWILTLLALALPAMPEAQPGTAAGFQVVENDDEIRIAGASLEASVRKRGYVSGVAGGSFLDRKTGFRDAGYGLDIVDWIMEPGSDESYRSELPGDLPYLFNNSFHGKRAKRSIEGPQICTRAKEIASQVVRGKDFVAVKNSFRYTLAAPGKNPGSLWEQTLLFPEGERFFLSTDRMTSVNASEAMFFRLDMPGHIKHTAGDTFSEVYLSYRGRIPASQFTADFPPDEKFDYRRDRDGVPKRFIRAYHLKDPATGRDGPWLAGMTLRASDVYEAWCHQRGYVCMIEEIGGRPVHPGQIFGAAFLVGYFDSIEEMNRVYDRYSGHSGLHVDEQGWKLTATAAPAPPKAAAKQAPAEMPEQRLARRMEWFKDQKFGLMLHWAPYSQWGSIESWPLVEEDKWARPDDLKAWVERGRDMERFKRDYWALNKTFNPTKFDPKKWADAAKQAGMKYVVFTTKHHDGFSMFDTKLTDYRITSPDTPFSKNRRANVAKEVFNAFRDQGFGIGAYFSKADWHHPDYWDPSAPAKTRNPNYDTLQQPEKWNRFTRFVHGQIEEIVSGYGPIDILWLDAGQVRPPRQDIRMDSLVAMARRYQPGLIVADRTVGGPHENYRTPEQEVPEKPLMEPWETCMTMGKQWSYREDDQYKSTRQLIHLLVDVVAKGGNFLLNVGPQPDGQLPPPALTRLKEIGDWMRVNGEAIHGTRPLAPYKEGRIAFTRRGGAGYLIYLMEEGKNELPETLTVSSVQPVEGSAVRALGSRARIPWEKSAGGALLRIPASMRSAPPSSHAVVFRMDLPGGEKSDGTTR